MAITRSGNGGKEKRKRRQETTNIKNDNEPRVSKRRKIKAETAVGSSSEGGYPFMFPKTIGSKSHTSTRYSIDCGEVIRQCLSPTQQKKFEKTYFGHYLGMTMSRYSGTIAHSIITRQVKKDDGDLWYKIGGTDMKFGEWEFGLLSGLRFGDLGEWKKKIKKLEKPNRLREKYFSEYNTITNQGLNDVFKNVKWSKHDDEDAVAMAMLFFVCNVLVNNTPKRIVEDWLLDLADYHILFSAFPWGVFAWEKTKKYLKNDVRRNLQLFEQSASGKNCRISTPMDGFPLAFQAWIAEVCSDARSFYTDLGEHVIPRFHRWHFDGKVGHRQANKTATNANPPEFKEFKAVASEKQARWYGHLKRYVKGKDDKLLILLKVEEEALLLDCKTDAEDNVEEEEEEDIDISFLEGFEEEEGKKGYEDASREEEMQKLKSKVNGLMLEHYAWCTSHFDKLGAKVDGIGNRMTMAEQEIKDLKEKLNINTGQCSQEKAPTNEELICPIALTVAFPREDDVVHPVQEEQAQIHDDTPASNMDANTDLKPDSETTSNASKIGVKGKEKIQKKSSKKAYNTVMDKKDIRLYYDYEPRERMDSVWFEPYDKWVEGAGSEERMKVFGIKLDGTVEWFKKLEIAGNDLENTHINAWFALFNQQNDATSAWTATDTDFFAVCDLPKVIEGSKRENWEGAKYFTDIINGKVGGMKPCNNVERVFIPFNLKGKHWVLGVLELKELHLYIYDSMEDLLVERSIRTLLRTPLSIISKAMDIAGYFKNRGDGKKMVTWSRVEGVPQQFWGSNDCGVFTIILAQYLSSLRRIDHGKNTVYSFSNMDFRFFRLRVAVEIFSGCLVENPF